MSRCPCPLRSTSEHLNLVFIGHVDAGKSTTAGQILFLTGGVDDRTIEKYEREAKEKNRESWYMAYIMDTNEEERAKGKTVEVTNEEERAKASKQACGTLAVGERERQGRAVRHMKADSKAAPWVGE